MCSGQLLYSYLFVMVYLYCTLLVLSSKALACMQDHNTTSGDENHLCGVSLRESRKISSKAQRQYPKLQQYVSQLHR